MPCRGGKQTTRPASQIFFALVETNPRSITGGIRANTVSTIKRWVSFLKKEVSGPAVVTPKGWRAEAWKFLLNYDRVFFRPRPGPFLCTRRRRYRVFWPTSSVFAGRFFFPSLDLACRPGQGPPPRDRDLLLPTTTNYLGMGHTPRLIGRQWVEDPATRMGNTGAGVTPAPITSPATNHSSLVSLEREAFATCTPKEPFVAWVFTVPRLCNRTDRHSRPSHLIPNCPESSTPTTNNANDPKGIPPQRRCENSRFFPATRDLGSIWRAAGRAARRPAPNLIPRFESIYSMDGDKPRSGINDDPLRKSAEALTTADDLISKSTRCHAVGMYGPRRAAAFASANERRATAIDVIEGPRPLRKAVGFRLRLNIAGSA